MKKTWIFVLAVVIAALSLLTGCTNSSSHNIKSVSELNSSQYKIGLPQGAASMYTGEEYFSNAELVYYSSLAEGYTAVEYGKLDGFVFDSHALEYVVANNEKLAMLPESIGEENIVIGAPFGKEKLVEQINGFIKQYKEDGTYKEMYNRWIKGKNPQMPEIEAPKNPEMTVVIGTEGLNEPMTFYGKSGELTGFDIEFSKRLALYLKADVKLEAMTFDALIPAAASGKIDLLISNLNGTAAIKEQMLLSDSYIKSKISVLVQKSRAKSADPAAVDTSGLSGQKFGIITGSPYDKRISEQFSDKELVYFDSDTDMIHALKSKKIDALFTEKAIANSYLRNTDGIKISDGSYGEEKTSIALQKSNTVLREELNTAISDLKKDGTLTELQNKWFSEDDEAKVLSDITLTGEKGTIIMADDFTFYPYAYVKDTQSVGYSVDLMRNLCYKLGYNLEIKDVDFTGIVQGLKSGLYDVCCITKTAERAENAIFTDECASSPVVAVVRDESVMTATPKYSSIRELDGKKMGAQTGAIFFDISDKYINNTEHVYFNDMTGEIEALRSGKVEALVLDEPVARLLVSQIKDFSIMEEMLEGDEYGIALAKNSPLTDDVSRVIEQFKDDGTLDALAEKWFSEDESIKVMPELDFSKAEGTIRFAHENVLVPMAYVGEGGVSVGYDVELVMRIAHALNKNVELIPSSFDSLVPMLASGKADMAAGCMSITDQRKESVDFATSYYKGGIVLVVKNIATDMVVEKTSFFASIAESFEKNFIRENRWKLIFEGIGVTLFISVLSGIFGTILGFGICMLRRMKNKLASGASRVFIRAIQGTPIVVFLMILYYVIFGSSEINAIWVAIIGFAINFAAYVSEMIRTGIEAVDKGQIEAAQAIGFSKVKTFFKITFPQAAKHFLPIYKGEFISLVKMTSVVGYIAIQDLTKMSDIIRSRTYEAFFPLIATAIIYFIIAYVLTLLIDLVEIKIDSKRRKRIVKGVTAK
ncbi:ABC transporter permease subunit [Oscillospiraceae bacterium PP1C4]